MRLRDDTEFATKAQSDDDDHGKSLFEAAGGGQDDQMISQSGAVL